MKTFPGFQVLFPACSQSFPGESVRSRCSGFTAVTHMDVVPSLSNYIQQPGTLRTLGTGLKRHDFGLARAGNETGNSGNKFGRNTGRCEDRCTLYDRLVALLSLKRPTAHPAPARTITCPRRRMRRRYHATLRSETTRPSF
jgi:hypothetical protein